MAVSALTYRRYFTHVAEWRVGVSSATYSYAGEESGLGPLWWQPIDDPVVRLPIPGGYYAVKQLIGNYDLEVWLQVSDLEPVTQLLRTIDVDNTTAGVQTAVEWDSTPVTTAIDYLAFKVYNLRVTNSTDARASGTSTYVFSGHVYVGRILPRFERPATPWLIKFYADYVQQTDA